MPARNDGCILVFAGLIALTAPAGMAFAQAAGTAAPATSPTAPAEIQPGHPPPPATGSLGAGTTGPQTAVPAPLPRGSGADTPGGAARNGVIKPPPMAGDHDINQGVPAVGSLGTPVIPPPGSPGGNPNVVPK